VLLAVAHRGTVSKLMLEINYLNSKNADKESTVVEGSMTSTGTSSEPCEAGIDLLTGGISSDA
jgi:hypothetical protein